MTQERSSLGNSLVELVLIVAVALGLALGIQAFLVKPYRIPSPSMVPTLTPGQRVLVNRIGNNFGDPAIGDVTVFHPPEGAEDGKECGAQHHDDQACPAPTSKKADVNFIKRIVAGPGDKVAIVDGHVILNGKRQSEPFIRPCPGSDGWTTSGSLCRTSRRRRGSSWTSSAASSSIRWGRSGRTTTG